MRNIFSQLKKPWVPALIGLVLVVIATVIVMVLWGTSSEPEAVSVPVPSPVTVVDQQAGAEVRIATVDVPAPGVWVAVHNITDIGLGNVWGAARIRESRTDLVVSMLVPTVPGKEYAVVLYRDNGDNGFDRATDSVYIDLETGERVEERFRTLPE